MENNFSHFVSIENSAVSTYGSEGKKEETLIISLSLSIGVVLVGLSLMLYLRRRNKKHPMLKQEGRHVSFPA